MLDSLSVETSRPSLHETRDKRPLGRDLDWSKVSPLHYEYQKAFLFAVHDTMGIGGSVRVKWKVLGLAYNRRETWDKQSLGRNLDRSWCYYHTSVKFSWSQPMDPWIEWQHTGGCNTSSCPGPCITVACLEFPISFRLGYNFSPCRHRTDCDGVHFPVDWVWNSRAVSLATMCACGKQTPSQPFLLGPSRIDMVHMALKSFCRKFKWVKNLHSCELGWVLVWMNA
jgi:hypothetical protein